jgi:hypothetical protein
MLSVRAHLGRNASLRSVFLVAATTGESGGDGSDERRDDLPDGGRSPGEEPRNEKRREGYQDSECRDAYRQRTTIATPGAVNQRTCPVTGGNREYKGKKSGQVE